MKIMSFRLEGSGIKDGPSLQENGFQRHCSWSFSVRRPLETILSQWQRHLTLQFWNINLDNPYSKYLTMKIMSFRLEGSGIQDGPSSRENGFQRRCSWCYSARMVPSKWRIVLPQKTIWEEGKARRRWSWRSDLIFWFMTANRCMRLHPLLEANHS